MLKETLNPYMIYMAMNLHWFVLAIMSGTAVILYMRARSLWKRRKERLPGHTPPAPPLPFNYTFNPEDFSRLSQEFYVKHIENLSERHPSLLVRQLATEMRCMAHNHHLELESKTARPRVVQIGTSTVRTIELAELAWDQTGGVLEVDKRRFINNLRRLIYDENMRNANVSEADSVASVAGHDPKIHMTTFKPKNRNEHGEPA